MAKNETTPAEIVNPFNEGVTYAVFIKALKESGKSIDEYLSGQTLIKSDESSEDVKASIEWLKGELKSFEYNEKHKVEFLKIAAEEHKKLHTNNNKD